MAISPVLVREAQFGAAEDLAKERLTGRIWTMEHTGNLIRVSTDVDWMTFDVTSSYGDTLGSDSWSLHERSIERHEHYDRSIERHAKPQKSSASSWREWLRDHLERRSPDQAVGATAEPARAWKGDTTTAVLTAASVLYIAKEWPPARGLFDRGPPREGMDFLIHHNYGHLDFKITRAVIKHWRSRKMRLQISANDVCSLIRVPPADAPPRWYTDKPRAAWIIKACSQTHG